MADAPTTLSPRGIQELQDREGGLYLDAYQDAGGPAIGYGMHTIDGKPVKMGDKITADKANKEFDRQVREKYTPAFAKVLKVKITQAQFDALTSVAWNSPEAAANLARKLNRGEKLTLPDFLASATKKDDRGISRPFAPLAQRRTAEYEAFTRPEELPKATTSPAPAETTGLSASDEKQFQKWVQDNGIKDNDSPLSFYDYRGFWKQTGGVPHPPGSEQHFPDTFKQHGHPTFSVESQYSSGPGDGGTWNGDNYVPQATAAPAMPRGLTVNSALVPGSVKVTEPPVVAAAPPVRAGAPPPPSAPQQDAAVTPPPATDITPIAAVPPPDAAVTPPPVPVAATTTTAPIDPGVTASLQSAGAVEMSDDQYGAMQQGDVEASLKAAGATEMSDDQLGQQHQSDLEASLKAAGAVEMPEPTPDTTILMGGKPYATGQFSPEELETIEKSPAAQAAAGPPTYLHQIPPPSSLEPPEITTPQEPVYTRGRFTGLPTGSQPYELHDPLTEGIVQVYKGFTSPAWNEPMPQTPPSPPSTRLGSAKTGGMATVPPKGAELPIILTDGQADAAADMIEGAMKVGYPLAIIGALTDLPGTVLTLGLSAAAGAGGSAGAGMLGASPGQQRLAGDIAAALTALGGASVVKERISSGLDYLKARGQAARYSAQMNDAWSNEAGNKLPPAPEGLPAAPEGPTEPPGGGGGTPSPTSQTSIVSQGGPNWADIASRSSLDELNAEINSGKMMTRAKRAAFQLERDKRIAAGETPTTGAPPTTGTPPGADWPAIAQRLSPSALENAAQTTKDPAKRAAFEAEIERRKSTEPETTGKGKEVGTAPVTPIGPDWANVATSLSDKALQEQVEQVAKAGDLAKRKAFEDELERRRLGIAHVDDVDTVVAPPKYELSSTQANLPPVSASLIKDAQGLIDKEDLGPGGLETQPHVTVKYGLHGNDADEVRKVLEGVGPITATLGRLRVFPSGDDGTPLVVDVDSPELHALNAKIAAALPNTDTHPTYVPHVTLGYLKDDNATRLKYIGRETVKGHKFTIDSIAFAGRDGEQTEIPLTGKVTEPAVSVSQGAKPSKGKLIPVRDEDGNVRWTTQPVPEEEPEKPKEVTAHKSNLLPEQPKPIGPNLLAKEDETDAWYQERHHKVVEPGVGGKKPTKAQIETQGAKDKLYAGLMHEQDVHFAQVLRDTDLSPEGVKKLSEMKIRELREGGNAMARLSNWTWSDDELRDIIHEEHRRRSEARDATAEPLDVPTQKATGMLNQGKLDNKGFIKIGDKLYIKTGGIDRHLLEAVPIAKWKGAKDLPSSEERYAMWGRSGNPHMLLHEPTTTLQDLIDAHMRDWRGDVTRGDYNGTIVTFKGQQYVIADKLYYDSKNPPMPWPKKEEPAPPDEQLAEDAIRFGHLLEDAKADGDPHDVADAMLGLSTIVKNQPGYLRGLSTEDLEWIQDHIQEALEATDKDGDPWMDSEDEIERVKSLAPKVGRLLLERHGQQELPWAHVDDIEEVISTRAPEQDELDAREAETENLPVKPKKPTTEAEHGEQSVPHGSGQLPQRGGGAPRPGRTRRPEAVGDVQPEASEGAEGTGAVGAGHSDQGSGLENGIQRPVGDAQGLEPEPTAGGDHIPESVSEPPSGDTHDPGHRPPDYGLTPERIEAIIKRGGVTRAQDNLDAIKLVKRLTEEQRWATPEEQDVLAKYVGWGAADMADRLGQYPKTTWSGNEKRIWEELRTVTTEAERAAMKASSPYAHFTYDIYRPIWQVLEAAGFTGGRVLEPSVGTGHAFGFMPPSVRHESTLNGVELEPLTAAIAHHLYPSARIQAVGYEKSRIARGSQDLAVGNPPFGDWSISDPLLPKTVTESLHGYFFAKALEHVRPGGLVVFLTSRYLMDGPEWQQLRRYLMDRAEFVGAVRLPNTAFDKSAKTEVVTDIVVLRKLRDGEEAQNAKLFLESPRHPTLKGSYDRRTGKTGNIYRSAWYTEHPELVVGTESTEGSMYGANEYTVTGKDVDVAAGVATALGQVLPPGSYEPPSAESAGATTKMVEGKFKAGELRVSADGNGIDSVQTDGSIEDATPKKVVKATGKIIVDESVVDRIKGMIKIRDARNAVVTAMRDKASTDAQIKELQGKLTHTYDRFVRPFSKTPNWLNSPANKRAFKKDPEISTILALEKLKTDATLTTDKNGKTKLRLTYTITGKADIFTKRTMGADPYIDHVDTPKDALLASLGVQGHLDWPYMAQVFSGSPSKAAIGTLKTLLTDQGLLFEQPDGSYAIAEEYLSGDVVSKLADAETNPQKFAKNIEALTAVQPAPKTEQDVMDGRVSLVLGSHWIDPKDMNQFVGEQLGVSARDITYRISGTETIVRWEGVPTNAAVAASNRHPLTVHYNYPGVDAEGKPVGNAKDHYGFLDLVNDTLNLKVPHLGHYEGKGDNRVFIREPIAELAARANQQLLRDAWQTFVYSHPDVIGRMLETYNTRFNRSIERRFDGSHMAYPGMATLYNSKGEEIHFFPHQNNGIWRILTSGNTLLAHEVGAGKTFEMIAAAMEMRRTGRASKPMITVPTYLLKQWEQDIVRLYPNVKLLAFTEDDLAKNKRQEAMSRIANGNWDIVLVPHSSFGLLKVSEERLIGVMETWIEELIAAERAGGDDSESVKEMAKQRKRIEAKVQKIKDKIEKGQRDNALTWEQLGVDALFVDEAQAFKNLFFFSKAEAIRGLSRSESARSLDLFVKVLDINEQSHYRNLVLATATPVMNSIAEIFTMQRYLQPQTLEQYGVDNFDNWYAMFAQGVVKVERQPDNTYKEVLRLAKFNNLQLLARMTREVMDYVGWEDMPYLKLPKIRGNRIKIVQTEQHPMYPILHDWFVDRMQRIKDNPPHIDRQGNYIAPDRYDPLTGESMGVFDNILTVMTDAKKAAVDVRLIFGNRAKDWPGSRMQVAADEMYKEYLAEKSRKGVQLMFLDMGTPKRPPPLTFLANAEVEDETEGEYTDEAEEDPENEDKQAIAETDTDSFNLYDSLKAALVQRGVKPDEIAYIHQARNPAERVALFQAANEGRVRFVFASTDKGGVGMNIQERLGALHELDVPRNGRPGDLRQRMGRAIRQGNTYDEVGLTRYVTKGTTDEWLWGLLSTKDIQIRQFYRGEVSNLEEDDPSTYSLEEAQIRASNDARGVELIELKGKMSRLEAQAGAAERAVAQAHADIKNGQIKKKAAEGELKTLQTWVRESYTSKRGKGFEIAIGGKSYTDRAEADKALIRALMPIAAAEDDQARPVKVGDLGGVPIFAKSAGWDVWREEIVDKKKTQVHHHHIRVSVWMNGSDLGAFNPSSIGVDRAKVDDPKTLGEGQNPISSLVNNYENFPGYVATHQDEVKKASQQIAQGQRVLEHPSTAIDQFRVARERVMALEQEFKAEGAAREQARKAEPQPAAGAELQRMTSGFVKPNVPAVHPPTPSSEEDEENPDEPSFSRVIPFDRSTPAVETDPYAAAKALYLQRVYGGTHPFTKRPAMSQIHMAVALRDAGFKFPEKTKAERLAHHERVLKLTQEVESEEAERVRRASLDLDAPLFARREPTPEARAIIQTRMAIKRRLLDEMPPELFEGKDLHERAVTRRAYLHQMGLLDAEGLYIPEHRTADDMELLIKLQTGKHFLGYVGRPDTEPQFARRELQAEEDRAVSDEAARRAIIARTYVRATQNTVQVAGRGPAVAYVDAGQRFTPEEIQHIFAQPVVQRATNALMGVLDAVLDRVLGYDRPKIESTGILFDQGSLGVFLPRPGTQRAQASIYLNVFEMLLAGRWADTTSLQPIPFDQAVSRGYVTAVHEALHYKIAGHGPEFERALFELLNELGPDFAAEQEQRIARAYADPDRPTEYHRSLRELLPLYTTSRWRPEAEIDSFSRPGRGAVGSAALAGAEGEPARAIRRGREDLVAGETGALSLATLDPLAKPLELSAREVRNLRDGLRFIFAPDTRGPNAHATAATLRAHLSARDQRYRRMEKSLEKIRQMMDGWSHDQSMQFWAVMEGEAHRNTLDPLVADIADAYRDILDQYRDEVLKRGLLKNYLENYWPHEWVRGTPMANALRRLFGKRPIQGPESYRKRRSIPTMAGGIDDLHLEPMTWNPTTQLLRKLLEMSKSIMAHDMRADLKRQGLMKFVPEGQYRKIPPGWELYPENFVGVVYGPREVKVKTADGDYVKGEIPFGRLVAGRYYGPPEAVRLVKNHLSPGLYGKSLAFDLYRRVGNNFNMLQLGWSAFHMWLTGTESVVSKQALVLDLLQRGQYTQAAKKQLEVGPQSIVIDLIRGNKALKELYAHDADATSKLLNDTVNLVVQGGGGFGWTLFEHEGAPKKFMTGLRAGLGAISRGEYGRAAGKLPGLAWHGAFSAIELPTAAIMEQWVPRLKVAAYLELARMEIASLGPNPRLDDVRAVLMDVWDSIDNRFGQLRYDNLFWNATFKDLSMASVRAVGWNVGTLREMFGAFPAQYGQTRDYVTHQVGAGGGGGKGRPPMIPMQQAGAGPNGPRFEPLLLHRKMAWWLSMMWLYAVAGSIAMYLMTGKSPKTLKDRFFPQNGDTEPNGDPKRNSVIGYFRDMYAWRMHPVTTAAHKAHPLLTLLAEILENETFYGVEIHSPDDPAYQQMIDDLEYMWSEVRPIAWTNASRGMESTDTLAEKALKYAKQALSPMTPAPATVERSDAENLLYQWGERERTVKTKAEAQTAAETRAIRRGFNPNATPAERAEGQMALAHGDLTKRQILTAAKAGASRQTFLQYGFEKQPLDRALKLYEVMTPEERFKIKPFLMQKVLRQSANQSGAFPALYARYLEDVKLPTERPQ